MPPLRLFRDVMHENFFLTVLEETASTNAIAREQAAKGAPDGTVIRARRQTAGRGRRGNTWESPEGNLYVSFIFRPNVAAVTAGQLSFIMGIAVAETLAEFLPKEKKIGLKWPNDVLLGRQKIAGILLETEVKGTEPIDWIVAGIGVNLVPVAVENATSLEQEGAGKIDPALFLERLGGHVLDWINIWKGFGFEPVRQAWLQRAAGMGGEMTARLPNEEVKGVFSGMNPAGSLILSLPDGTERLISSGEVFFG